MRFEFEIQRNDTRKGGFFTETIYAKNLQEAIEEVKQLVSSNTDMIILKGFSIY